MNEIKSANATCKIGDVITDIISIKADISISGWPAAVFGSIACVCLAYCYSTSSR